jgi:hypothetical protein
VASAYQGHRDPVTGKIWILDHQERTTITVIPDSRGTTYAFVRATRTERRNDYGFTFSGTATVQLFARAPGSSRVQHHRVEWARINRDATPPPDVWTPPATDVQIARVDVEEAAGGCSVTVRENRAGFVVDTSSGLLGPGRCDVFDASGRKVTTITDTRWCSRYVPDLHCVLGLDWLWAGDAIDEARACWIRVRPNGEIVVASLIDGSVRLGALADLDGAVGDSPIRYDTTEYVAVAADRDCPSSDAAVHWDTSELPQTLRAYATAPPAALTADETRRVRSRRTNDDGVDWGNPVRHFLGDPIDVDTGDTQVADPGRRELRGVLQVVPLALLVGFLIWAVIVLRPRSRSA